MGEDDASLLEDKVQRKRKRKRKLREVRGRITNETKESIKIKMQEIDARQWKEELNEKGSLVLYAKWRKEIGGSVKVVEGLKTKIIPFGLEEVCDEVRRAKKRE